MRSPANELLKTRRRLIRAYLKLRGVEGYRHISDFWPWVTVDSTRESGCEVRYRSRRVCTTLPIGSLFGSPLDTAIIGSGPSIKMMDPDKVSGLRCILLNGAVKLVEMWGVKPFATVIIDSAFIENRFDLLKCLPQGSNLVVTPGVIRAIAERRRHFLDTMNVYLTQDISKPAYESGSEPHLEMDPSGRPVFSYNMDYGYVDGGTVCGAALQLVHQIGAENTYLVGMDMGSSGGPRFYETEANGLKCLLDEDYETLICPFMSNAASIFRRDNRAVYNCSPISRLPYEVFPFFDGFVLKMG